MILFLYFKNAFYSTFLIWLLLFTTTFIKHLFIAHESPCFRTALLIASHINEPRNRHQNKKKAQFSRSLVPKCEVPNIAAFGVETVVFGCHLERMQQPRHLYSPRRNFIEHEKIRLIDDSCCLFSGKYIITTVLFVNSRA